MPTAWTSSSPIPRRTSVGDLDRRAAGCCRAAGAAAGMGLPGRGELRRLDQPADAGRPAGPQPDHGPRRPGRARQVHDPRPGTGLHRRARRQQSPPSPRITRGRACPHPPSRRPQTGHSALVVLKAPGGPLERLGGHDGGDGDLDPLLAGPVDGPGGPRRGAALQAGPPVCTHPPGQPRRQLDGEHRSPQAPAPGRLQRPGPRTGGPAAPRWRNGPPAPRRPRPPGHRPPPAQRQRRAPERWHCPNPTQRTQRARSADRSCCPAAATSTPTEQQVPGRQASGACFVIAAPGLPPPPASQRPLPQSGVDAAAQFQSWLQPGGIVGNVTCAPAWRCVGAGDVGVVPQGQVFQEPGEGEG